MRFGPGPDQTSQATTNGSGEAEKNAADAAEGGWFRFCPSGIPLKYWSTMTYLWQFLVLSSWFSVFRFREKTGSMAGTHFRPGRSAFHFLTSSNIASVTSMMVVTGGMWRRSGMSKSRALRGWCEQIVNIETHKGDAALWERAVTVDGRATGSLRALRRLPSTRLRRSCRRGSPHLM